MHPSIVVAELPASRLAEYASIPIAFEATSRLVRTDGDEGFTTRALSAPYHKDYDALGESPREWPATHAVHRWGLLVASREGVIVGGAAVAPPGDVMRGMDLPGHPAVLWDLRVAPDARGHGVGTALFRAAQDWARAQGISRMVVETQDINVAACRLYMKLGCRLLSFDAEAYESAPGEARMLWSCSTGDSIGSQFFLDSLS